MTLPACSHAGRLRHAGVCRVQTADPIRPAGRADFKYPIRKETVQRQSVSVYPVRGWSGID